MISNDNNKLIEFNFKVVLKNSKRYKIVKEFFNYFDDNNNLSMIIEKINEKFTSEQTAVKCSKILKDDKCIKESYIIITLELTIDDNNKYCDMDLLDSININCRLNDISITIVDILTNRFFKHNLEFDCNIYKIRSDSFDSFCSDDNDNNNIKKCCLII